MMAIKTIVFFLCMTIFPLKTNSLCESQNEFYPDKLACPVTPNVFPEQIKSGQLIRYVFSGQEVAHRISISLQAVKGVNLKIQFRWIGAWNEFTRPPFRDFGARFGSFVVKADGVPNYFFLGPNANIPGNIPFHEFDLQIPVEAEVIDVAFSSMPSEIVSSECPMPSLEKEISGAFDDYKSNPKDQARIRRLIQLLAKTIPTYDCRRDYDYTPIPAWWMANENNIDKWFAFVLERVKKDDRSALRLLVQFYATSDGYLKEGLSYRLLEILLNQPALVLNSWADIREYGEKISGVIRFQSPESTSRMVNIYREIGAKNHALRSACDELVELLEKGY